MANYYIDPVSGTGDGSSTATPAGSLPATLVNDTVYLFKNNTTYVRSTAISISSKSNIQFGSYGTGKATITCSNTTSGNTTITISTGGTTDNLVLSNLIFNGSDNGSGLYIGSNVSLISISNVDFIKSNIGTGNHISFGGGFKHSNVTITDTTFSNGIIGIVYQCTTPNITISNWNLQNLTLTGSKDYAIRLSLEVAAWDTSQFSNITMNKCSIYDCYGGVWFRSSNSSYTSGSIEYWTPTIRGNNVTITNSTFQYSTFTIDNTFPGGINITGFNNCYIANNYLKNVTTKGAAIQTTLSTNMLIERNYIEHAISVALSSGKYIDAIGIFVDQGDQYCTVRYNTIVDCPGYNIEGNSALMAENSGGGIAFWNSGYNNVYCNLILSSRYGISYGQVNEIGNRVFNNYILDCSNTAFRKHGTAYLAGNIALFNNGIINTGSVSFATQNLCANISYNDSFNTVANAKITVDANGIPTSILDSSNCFNSGTDLDDLYFDENGITFYSPPHKGAFSSVRGIGDELGLYLF